MKNRAFTLIELLAVIVILAIVLAIAIPGIKTVIDSTKTQAYNSQISMAKKAASLYVEEKLMKNETVEKYIMLDTLKESKYLSEIPKDPINGGYLKGVIKTIKNGDKYNCEYLDVNSESGEVVLVDSSKQIKNIIVEGNSKQTESTGGKNLFDIQGIIRDGIANGIDPTTVGSYVENGNEIFWHTTVAYTENYWRYRKGMFKDNTQYTLSFDGQIINASNPSTVVSIRFVYKDGTSSYVSIYTNNTRRTITSTANETIDYIKFSSWGWSGKLLMWNIQLEEGTTATPYEKFIPIRPSSTYLGEIKNVSGNLMLGGNPYAIPELRGIGNSTDRYVFNTGVCTRKIGVKTFNGSETIALPTSNPPYGYISYRFIDSNFRPPYISNYYPYKNEYGYTQPIDKEYIKPWAADQGQMFFLTCEYLFPTVDLLKQYLTTIYNQNNPLVVYYNLITPTTTNLSSNTIPSNLYYIYLDSEVDGNIIVEYN